jgi:hypothetical protein
MDTKSFFLGVLTAFVIGSLYETGVVPGDVLSVGVRSMLPSMEARLELGGDQASTSEQQLQPTLPCFLDSPMENGADYVELVPYCADPPTVFRPCPSGAWCAGGVLELCNRDSDQCVLPAAIQEFIQKSSEWTIQDGCTRERCSYTTKRTNGFPLFYYTQLMGDFEETGWDMNFLQVADAARFAATGKYLFYTMRENDNDLIGLHPDSYTPLPFGCVLKRGLFYLVATFAMSVCLILRTVGVWLFDIAKNLFFTFPLESSMVSLVGLAGLWAAYVIRSGHRNKQQMLIAPAPGLVAPAQGGMFGTPAPAQGGFGAPAAAPAGGGLFGAPAASPSQQHKGQGGGTRVVPYQVTQTQDGSSAIQLQAITAMPQYEHKSFEELRYEDYVQGNRGSSTPQAATQQGGFGGGFGSQAPAPADGGSLFGAPAPAQGGFGAPAPADGGLFGAPAPATGEGFGGGVGGAAPAPAGGGGLFGAPAPAQGGFGAPAPAGGGSFGALAPSTGGGFGGGVGGAAPAPAGGGLFGAPAPAAGEGFGGTDDDDSDSGFLS